ncbi:MAG: quinolinate synthase NadA [Planctomycetia bacterium]|jgi:quinolinate synthase
MNLFEPLALEAYHALTPEELTRRIQAVRDRLGSKLVILGHHYQRDEVIAMADLRGDSFQLSKMVAESEACETIVFCGVHFMAETADILANRPERLAQRAGKRVPVILPDLEAGCSMADMADDEQVEACWEQLAEVIDINEVTPVTYVNSTAALKAFCGRHGGIVCTSSNARQVLEWAMAQRPRVLFFPDQHLGRNTALTMGIPVEAMPVWDPAAGPLGGNTAEQLRDGRVYLWQGYCDVHQKFLPEHVDQLRRETPDVRVIVHPECMREVVDPANLSGSTGKIITEVEAASAGTKWAIGTEVHLVDRLKQEHPEQEIQLLGQADSLCPTMDRINLANLCWSLEHLAAGNPVNIIRVDDETARDALTALERMLEVA